MAPVIARGSISELRQAVADAITTLPCYSTPPDDIAHVPCVVVGPPSMTRQPAIGGLWDISFDVVVIGRRYDFAEAHLQLDDAAWDVVGELEGTKVGTAYLKVSSVQPGIHSIAGFDHPTHTVTAVATAVYC